MADKAKAPDVLGKDGRVQIVLNMLRNIQSQRVSLEVEQEANQLADDAPAPAAPHRTVAEHRKSLDDSEQRVLAKFSDVIPDIRRLTGQ